MDEDIRLRIYLLADYRYTPPTPRPQSGLPYRPLRVARNVHTHQEMVVYDGLAGPDRGRTFLCTLADWHDNFTLDPDEAPGTAKVAGRLEQGSGA